MNLRGISWRERGRTVLQGLYAIRVQIVGWLVQYPLSAYALGTRMLRGLADLTPKQVLFVGFWAFLHSSYLAITANIVLLWSPARLQGTRTRVERPANRLLRIRRFVSVVSIPFWIGFMSAVHSRCTSNYFWLSAILGAITGMLLVLLCEGAANRSTRSTRYRLFLLWPYAWTDSFDEPARRAGPASDTLHPPPASRTWWSRTRPWRLAQADRILEPGFLDYGCGIMSIRSGGTS